jgi:hypothetical protein
MRLKDLGNVQRVGDKLTISATNIKNLNNLQSVGGSLSAIASKLENLENLGNLEYVGGDFDIRKTPMSKKYSEEEIRDKIDVRGNIYM